MNECMHLVCRLVRAHSCAVTLVMPLNRHVIRVRCQCGVRAGKVERTVLHCFRACYSFLSVHIVARVQRTLSDTTFWWRKQAEQCSIPDYRWCWAFSVYAVVTSHNVTRQTKPLQSFIPHSIFTYIHSPIYPQW